MLHHAEHPAGLERLVHRRKRLRRLSPRHPVMDVAERHHHIDGVGRQRIAAVDGEIHHYDSIVQVGPGGELAAVSFQALADVTAGRIGRDDRRVVLAMGAHQRSDHFRVPTRLGPDLEHPRLRAHAEEQQRLARVPVAVAALLGTVVAREHAVQRLERRLARAGGRAARGHEQAGRQREGCEAHGPTGAVPCCDRVVAEVAAHTRSWQGWTVHITPVRGAISRRADGARKARAGVSTGSKKPRRGGVFCVGGALLTAGAAFRERQTLQLISGGMAPLPGAGVADVPGLR